MLKEAVQFLEKAKSSAITVSTLLMKIDGTEEIENIIRIDMETYKLLDDAIGILSEMIEVEDTS